MSAFLIVDAGATKCEWCLITEHSNQTFTTIGLSLYFMDSKSIIELVEKELIPNLISIHLKSIFFYGTGLGDIRHQNEMKSILKSVFSIDTIEISSDILGAARAVCQREKGMVSILGTGSNSCYFNGNKITKNNPSLGFILGDEGSGAYLGKKVLQYYLYKTFDSELIEQFEKRFSTNETEILSRTYKSPFPNRYLASFAMFLAENRGHYMIENIIEDGLTDFFFHHLYKYRESWKYPLHFVGSISFVFRDVLQDLCNHFQLELGKVVAKPMDGLVQYHTS